MLTHGPDWFIDASFSLTDPAIAAHATHWGYSLRRQPNRPASYTMPPELFDLAAAARSESDLEAIHDIATASQARESFKLLEVSHMYLKIAHAHSNGIPLPMLNSSFAHKGAVDHIRPWNLLHPLLAHFPHLALLSADKPAPF
jgi:hypothetical protein